MTGDGSFVISAKWRDDKRTVPCHLFLDKIRTNEYNYTVTSPNGRAVCCRKVLPWGKSGLRRAG